MTSAPSFPLLISAVQLQSLQASGRPLMVFDCSFDLAQPSAGMAQYQEAHIPGALYADLDQHLSARPGDPAASGGRHPLPSREAFAAWLRSVGFNNAMQAVVYDRQGVNYCGRLWWMLKWAGHEAVAVLDGGLPVWQAAGGAVQSGGGPVPTAPGDFALQTPLRRLVSVDTVQAQLGSAAQTIVDARAPARFRGEVEPLDPVAGHIPGAEPPVQRQHCAGCPLQARRVAQSRVRCAACRARSGQRGAPVRQRGQRRAQSDCHGSGRLCPHRLVCRQLEQMVQ